MDVDSLDTQEDAAPLFGINRKCTIERGRRCCPIIKVRPYVKKVKKVVDVVKRGVRQIIGRSKK